MKRQRDTHFLKRIYEFWIVPHSNSETLAYAYTLSDRWRNEASKDIECGKISIDYGKNKQSTSPATYTALENCLNSKKELSSLSLCPNCGEIEVHSHSFLSSLPGFQNVSCRCLLKPDLSYCPCGRIGTVYQTSAGGFHTFCSFNCQNLYLG